MRGFTIQFLSAMLLFGCTSGSGSCPPDDTPGPDGGTTDPDSGNTRRDAGDDTPPGALCSRTNPCPAGQFCFNGVCAIGCNSDADCASNQYCDTEFDRLCHNRTVSTCPDTPCPEGQECDDGLCAAPPVQTDCEPRPDGNDGCDEYSLCLIEDFEDQTTACYSFPACDANGECPVGTAGAVCNGGLIPNKARFCLIGQCQTDAHCPSAWGCVKDERDTFGICSDGRLGATCLEDADCIEELSCNRPFPGEPGFCMENVFP